MQQQKEPVSKTGLDQAGKVQGQIKDRDYKTPMMNQPKAQQTLPTDKKPSSTSMKNNADSDMDQDMDESLEADKYNDKEGDLQAQAKENSFSSKRSTDRPMLK